MSKKHSAKGDLDSFLVQLKADNQLTTKRPYSGHLVHQVRQLAPQVGHKTLPIEIADDQKKQTSSKNHSTQFFKNLVVIFPCVSVNLTKIRISILGKLVTQYGGILGDIEDYNNQQGYIVVAKEVQKQTIEQTLDKFGLFFQNLQSIIITSEWITDSVAAKQLLNYQSYQLLKDTKIVEEKQLQEQIQISKINVDQVDEDVEFDINFIFSLYDDDEKVKQMKKRTKVIKNLFKQHRQILDYNYDNRLANYHESYDEDDDQLLEVVKKEEKQEHIYHKQEYEDDECFISDIKKERGVSLFEGMDLPKQVYFDLEDPLKSSQMRDNQFMNIGLKKRAQYWEQKKDRFVCEAGSSNVNHNEHIIQHLDRLLKCYTNDKDKGRIIAYRRAIAVIKSQKFQIKSEEDIQNMPTIGTKIKDKIIEILQTGKLGKADKLASSVKNQCQDIFTQVWGIGPETAAMFYFKGLRTIDDLKKNQHLLNRNQKIGLQYVEEFKQRIPRAECEKLVSVIQDQIQRLSESPGLYQAIACGSFRRLKPDCGDIDVLITRMDGKNPQGFLLKLVESLEKTLLTDHLVLPKSNSSHGSESYMGVGQLYQNLPHRRIDMKLYPSEQYGTAVLYFTGSDHFNRSMRLFAQKKGYTLSDHGLYPALRAIRNQKIWKGEIIPCYTEEDVFKVLGLTYKKPEERSV